MIHGDVIDSMMILILILSFIQSLRINDNPTAFHMQESACTSSGLAVFLQLSA